MAQDVTINKVQYNDVPAFEFVKQGGGTVQYVDTTDANATASDMLSPKTAYVNGTKVTGGIPSKSSANYQPSTVDQTINAQQYLAGAQTIKKVTTSNLSAQYIAQGVTVKVGSEADDDCIASVTGTLTSPVVSQDPVTKIVSIS